MVEFLVSSLCACQFMSMFGGIFIIQSVSIFRTREFGKDNDESRYSPWWALFEAPLTV